MLSNVFFGYAIELKLERIFLFFCKYSRSITRVTAFESLLQKMNFNWTVYVFYNQTIRWNSCHVTKFTWCYCQVMMSVKMSLKMINKMSIKMSIQISLQMRVFFFFLKKMSLQKPIQMRTEISLKMCIKSL